MTLKMLYANLLVSLFGIRQKERQKKKKTKCDEFENGGKAHLFVAIFHEFSQRVLRVMHVFFLCMYNII